MECPNFNVSETSLDALNIMNESRNLAFLDGKQIIKDEIELKDLEILFKKIIQ